jgi:adenosylcobyric acid synthase
VKGYELHTEDTVTEESPLFTLSVKDSKIDEGSVIISEKLFGTYVHGLFDEPAFRRYLLELTGKYVPSECSRMSYEEILDATLDKLADTFESSADMKLFDEIMGCQR